MIWKQIHETALYNATVFKRSESALLSSVMEVDRHRVFEHFGLTSTFSYCVKVLGLSEDQTCNLIRVARLSELVPQVKDAIDAGKLNVSTARKIAPVVTPQNQEDWIGRAQNLPRRELEKQVAEEAPTPKVREKVKPIGAKQFVLHCNLDAEGEALLKKAQDLLSQKAQKGVEMGEAVKAALKELVRVLDPVAKAERGRKSEASVTAIRDGKRVARPKAVDHAVNQRDQGQCTFVHPEFGRCQSKRWLHRHHKVEVAKGGEHSAENIETLCSAHHRILHKNLSVCDGRRERTA